MTLRRTQQNRQRLTQGRVLPKRRRCNRRWGRDESYSRGMITCPWGVVCGARWTGGVASSASFRLDCYSKEAVNTEPTVFARVCCFVQSEWKCTRGLRTWRSISINFCAHLSRNKHTRRAQCCNINATVYYYSNICETRRTVPANQGEHMYLYSFISLRNN